MTQKAYQAVLARLVTRPGLLDESRGVAGPADPNVEADLSAIERRRIDRVASDPGLRVIALLITSFRLGKLVTLLPLTRALLGPKLLAEQAERFWASWPPTSFYLLEEAIAFCDHLLLPEQELDLPYLREVVGYERAMLLLRRVQPAGRSPDPQVVRFTHDPSLLLPPLASGRIPEAVPEMASSFVGSLNAEGEIDWSPLAHP